MRCSLSYSWLLLVLFGLTLPTQAVAQAKPSPLGKLDRKELTPLEAEMLPDITVAATRPTEGTQHVSSLTFAPDGKLASGNRDGTVAIWDLSGTKPRLKASLELDPMKGSVEAVRYSPDGKQLVAVQPDTLAGARADRKAAMTVFQFVDEDVNSYVRYEMSIDEDIAFHPAKNTLFYRLTGNEGRAVALEGGGLATLPHVIPGANSGFAFSPDGGTFAAIVFNPARNGKLYGSEFKFWKVGPDSLTERVLVQRDEGFKALAFSPNGKWLATASLDKFVRVWSLDGTEPVEKAKFAVEHWPRSVYFAGGSEYVACVSSMNQILLYNIAADKVEKTWMLEPRRGSKLAEGAMYLSIKANALAPDGQHLAISNHNAQTLILRLPVPVK